MIWLIGNKGMLGTELSGVFESSGMDYAGTDREVDIRDLSALRRYAREAEHAGNYFDWIVNCSAYTAVDKAEEEEQTALGINALGAENIAKLAAELDAALIHVSTDYVFRGDGNAPYLESDPMDPAGAYGRTKAAGEKLVAAACQNHFILRTAWLYGKHGPNFVYTMLKLMSAKDSINVVGDQRGTPTWAYDLAQAMAEIIASNSNKYGIYHFTNEGRTDWHAFAVEIQRLGREFGILAKECAVNRITSDQYPSKVKRPAWSVLSKEKIKRELGIEPPDWKASLRTFLKGIADWPGLDERIGART
jgi:dTDP-4-dehydrorhamnose reductase